MGILSAFKNIGPGIIYAVTFFLILRALMGKTEWLLMSLIVLLPLRNVIEKLHVLPLGKDFLDILFFILILGTLVRKVQSKSAIISRSPISTVALIMISYMFVSLFIGSSYLGNDVIFDISDTRVQAWKNFCLMPILFLITLNTVNDKKWVWRTVLIMCVTMAVMDTYLVRQISWFSNIESRVKIHGTFVYLGPNEVSAFYNQYTILLLGLFFSMKKSFTKINLLGLILINLFCVLFLFSRAAYLGLAVGMFFIFSIKNKKLLIPLLLVIIYWQVALPQKVQERILETTNAYGELDESSEARLIIWQNAIDLFYENPIAGVGFGVFSKLGFRLGDTHNIYVKILAEQGVVGLFMFLLLLFVLFFRGIKLFWGGNDNLSKGMGLGFSISIITLMVNNMFGDRWSYLELSSFLWVFAALVERCNIISSEEQIKKPAIRKQGKSKTPLLCEL